MRIEENNPLYLDDFIHLNEQWISKYFKLEAIDRELAKNPDQIIDKGGYIFTLLSDHKVLGVCALFYQGSGVFELARMAVSPEYQGKGYGQMLIDACLAKLAQIEVNRLYLVSNTKLKSAMALYSKNQFKTVSLGQHPVYQRADIVMEYQGLK
ncbi:GNAT family N-acetyltransferase [Thalassotalea aquiviva]|uniref:GNAT family N-acetyltransferase n=1 Tax=Thalassotalea aquiviva TaxID=3242415 RepID=UPI00352AB80C